MMESKGMSGSTRDEHGDTTTEAVALFAWGSPAIVAETIATPDSKTGDEQLTFVPQ